MRKFALHAIATILESVKHLNVASRLVLFVIVVLIQDGVGCVAFRMVAFSAARVLELSYDSNASKSRVEESDVYCQLKHTIDGLRYGVEYNLY